MEPQELSAVPATGSRPRPRALLPALASIVWGMLAMSPALAATVTNIMTGSSNYPGNYAIAPVAGDTRVDIWSAANGASFTVVSNLVINPAASAKATVILDGSTNLVLGNAVVAYQRVVDITGSGAGTLSLINQALLTVSNVSGCVWLSGIGGTLTMTNSTLRLFTGYDSMYFTYGGANNNLVMDNSLLDMKGTVLSIGFNGSGTADIRDSIITNLGVLHVSSAGGGGRMYVSNSVLHVSSAYSLRLDGGTAASTIGLLSLDRSRFIGGGTYAYIGSGYAGTGVFSLANGSLVNVGGAFGLGRTSVGRAQAIISNSTWNTASECVGGWINVFPGELGGRASVALYDGTNSASSVIYVGGATNSYGSYVARGASRVTTPSLVVGAQATSTGTFTTADSTVVAVTNAGGTANITVGDVGKGTFTIDGVGGAVTANTFTAGANDSILKFVLTTNGITPINVTGLMTMKSGAKLVIDVTQYKQPPALVLANYGSRTGSFDPANITIIGGDADVIQTATRISVKILGIGTVIFIQ